MQYTKYLLILLGLAFASASHAQVQLHVCRSCSDVQFERMALELDTGIHYLYDFNRNIVRRYKVQRLEVEASPDGERIFDLAITREPVPDKMQKTYDAIRNVWVLVNANTAFVPLSLTQKPIVLESADLDVSEQLRPISAVDIVPFGALQHRLRKDVRSAILEHAVSQSGEPIPMDGSALGRPIEIFEDVKFADFTVILPGGGSVEFRYDPDGPDEFQYHEGASLDAAGNRIPEPGVSKDVLRRYEFDKGDSFHRLGKYLTNFFPNVSSWPKKYCDTVDCLGHYPEPKVPFEEMTNQQQANWQQNVWRPDAKIIECGCVKHATR